MTANLRKHWMWAYFLDKQVVRYVEEAFPEGADVEAWFEELLEVPHTERQELFGVAADAVFELLKQYKMVKQNFYL